MWLQEVDKFALQNSLRDLNTAYNNFFREIAKGNKKQGFPKFKSKHKSKEKYRTNFTNGNICIDLEARQIKLPKLGWVKFLMGKKTEMFGIITNATINKTSTGKYFVSVLHQIEIRELPENMNYTGYDLGLNTYAIDSNNNLIENPRYLRQEAKKLAMLQRQLARMKKGSSNYMKQKIKIARQHERVANMRKDFLHQQSTKIVRENQVICLEDLQVKNMVKNHKLAKSISSFCTLDIATL